MSTTPRSHDRDPARAFTSSLLGWGMVAGPFYLTVGLAQALTREGFDLSRHALSLLMLGEGGWIQSANLAATGLMVLAASIGFVRASGRRGAGVALGLYGVSLVASAMAAPDPMLEFPPGSAPSDAPSMSGLLHLAAGGVGFVALAFAALIAASWFAQAGADGVARLSRASSGVVAAGFFVGAALATRPVGVALIWVAVVAGFAWLAIGSFAAYRLASASGPIDT